jgi:predicted Zn-dependent protease
MLTAQDVDAIVTRAAKSGQHDAAAARLEELADQPDQHGEEITRITLLVDAGAQHSLADDWDAAIRCYRAAVADGGENPYVDPRVWLHDALLRTGRRDEATGLLRELKASRSRDPDFYTAIAESLEGQGLLGEANTWFTMGYHRCQHADLPDALKDVLLVGRLRVRREIGYPADDLDELAEAYIDVIRER